MRIVKRMIPMIKLIIPMVLPTKNPFLSGVLVQEEKIEYRNKIKTRNSPCRVPPNLVYPMTAFDIARGYVINGAR